MIRRLLFLDGAFIEQRTTLQQCREIVSDEDAFFIEAAADYDEDSLGCQEARALYGRPIVRLNLTHLARVPSELSDSL